MSLIYSAQVEMLYYRLRVSVINLLSTSRNMLYYRLGVSVINLLSRSRNMLYYRLQDIVISLLSRGIGLESELLVYSEEVETLIYRLNK